MRKPRNTVEVRVHGGGSAAKMSVYVDKRTMGNSVSFSIEHEENLAGDINRFESYSVYNKDDKKPFPETYHDLESELSERMGRALFGSMSARTPLHRVLERSLRGLDPCEFVRILLWFEDPDWARYPWELAQWRASESAHPVWVGRDRRIALTRLDNEHSDKVVQRDLVGDDQVLSLFNIGMYKSDDSMKQYELTKAYLLWLGRHLPALHVASAGNVSEGGISELVRHWRDSVRLTGRYPRTDIIHWHGHGGQGRVRAVNRYDEEITIDAGELFRRTEGTFLYVLNSCESGADNTAGRPGFSSDLLRAGAPAVLGIYDDIGQWQFEELPVLYTRLLQGFCLDDCVQYLRRLFALENLDSQSRPREPWHKLALRVVGECYLDGIAIRASRACGKGTSFSAPIALDYFDKLRERQARGPQAREPEYPSAGKATISDDPSLEVSDAARGGPQTLLRRHYDAELIGLPSV